MGIIGVSLICRSVEKKTNAPGVSLLLGEFVGCWAVVLWLLDFGIRPESSVKPFMISSPVSQGGVGGGVGCCTEIWASCRNWFSSRFLFNTKYFTNNNLFSTYILQHILERYIFSHLSKYYFFTDSSSQILHKHFGFTYFCFKVIIDFCFLHINSPFHSPQKTKSPHFLLHLKWLFFCFKLKVST